MQSFDRAEKTHLANKTQGMQNYMSNFSSYFSVFTRAGRLFSVDIVHQLLTKLWTVRFRVANSILLRMPTCAKWHWQGRAGAENVPRIIQISILAMNIRNFYLANETCVWCDNTTLRLYNIVKEK